MRNYFNYFTEVEDYFVRKRGKNILISPLDWCLVEVWKEMGIPLQVVLRGIDRSFDSPVKGRSRKAEPRTLFYCHSAVQEAYEEYQQAMLGAGELGGEGRVEGPEFSKRRLTDFLDRLEKAVRESPLNDPRRPLERLELLKQEVRAGRVEDPGRLDSELSQIGTLVVNDLMDSMDRQKIKELKKRVRADLKIYRKRLAPETLKRLTQTYLEKQVRDLFNLPDFDLLSSPELLD